MRTFARSSPRRGLATTTPLFFAHVRGDCGPVETTSSLKERWSVGSPRGKPKHPIERKRQTGSEGDSLQEVAQKSAS